MTKPATYSLRTSRKGEYVLAIVDKSPKANQYIPSDETPCGTLKEFNSDDHDSH